MKKILQQKLLHSIFLLVLLCVTSISWGQTTLTLPTTGTSYTENFNTTPGTNGTSYPIGWIAYNGSTSDNAMISGTATSTTGANYNYVSKIGILGSGSAFIPSSIVLEIANTTGKTGLSVSYNIIKMREQGRSNTFNLEISTTSATAGFTAVTGGTYASGTIAEGVSTAYTNIILPTTANNSTGKVWLRWYYSEAGGSGSRDGVALDDVVLRWANPAAVPTVSTTQVTAAGITTATAISGGNVTANGGSTVTTRGVVYSATANPDLDDNVVATGNGTGTFTSSLTDLLANTQYHYRAYAINTTGTGYGTEYNFFTKANTPAALTVSNPTLNSLNVAINSTDNNPAGTQYAIAISGGLLPANQYVNAAGEITSVVVYQTATQWATTLTVTGLDAATTYTFTVKARNNAATPVETDFGPTSAGTTLTPTTPYLTPGTINLTNDTICLNNTATGYFSISGGNLVNHTINIGALNGFSYSFTENNETYSNTLDIVNYNGEELTVYVRFSPTAIQSYNGNIALTGTDVPTLEIEATGTGIDTPGTATTRAATAITSVSAVLNGTSAAGGCTAINGYGIEYSTLNNFTPGTGTRLAGTDLNVLPDFSITADDLAPGTTYYFRAYVADGSTINGGLHYGSQLSFTTATLSTPVTTAAINTTQTTFTANWNAVAGAQGYRLDVSEHEIFGTATYATDLIISEYIEGASNNKAIEIYNGTGVAVNLSAYSLRQQLNGSGGFGSGAEYTLPLPNVNLAYGDVYVVASTGATLISNVDMPVAYTDSPGGRVVHFTGNDPVGLYKNEIQIDLITGGTDVTLVRNTNVNEPTTNYDANQWTTYANGTYNYIGSHNMNTNFVPSFVTIYNNLDTGNVTSQSVTGLDPFTTYYYRVRAYSTNSTSANSNTTGVITKPEQLTWTIASGRPTAAWIPAVYPDNTPVVVDETIDVFIDANYNTESNGSFTAKNVTLNTGKTFTVATGTTVNIKGQIINNAPAANFVVENNGALLQDSDIENTANITVIKNSNPLYRLDYTLWSAPVTGQTLGNFSPATSAGRFYEYKYDFDANANNGLGGNVEQYFTVAPTTVFEAAKGYLIRMPNGNFSVPGYNGGDANYSYEGVFIGVPNNGIVQTPASVEGNRYTAVGNPYPSPISVVAFFEQNRDVINTNSGIYFWRKKNDAAASSYATLTLAAYTANAGFGENETAGGGAEQAGFFEGDERNWIISQGQGFFVQTAEEPVSTTITFTNSMRKPSPGRDQAFLRTGQSLTSRYWINLTDALGGFSQAAVAYMPNATTGLDYGYDGAKFGNGGRVTLYSLAADTNLAVQARPAFTTTDVVPMGFIANNTGEFTISLDHADGLFVQGQNIYLRDNVTGLIHNLGNNNYTFTTEAGTFNNRFEVIYTTDALSNNEPLFTADNVIVYKEGNSININAGTTQITGVTVFDINGRSLYTKSNEGTFATISNLQVAQQLLVVEITTVKGKVSKKIVF